MTTTEVTILLERLNNQITAMWILIGLMGVCALAVVLFLIPLMSQLKKTMKEAEITTKNVNTELMPRINSMVAEAEPVISKSIVLLGTVISSISAIVGGLKYVGNIIVRRKNKKEA